MKQIQTQHLIQVEDLTKQNFEQKEKLDDIEKWMETKGFKTEQRDNLDNALKLEEQKHQDNLLNIKKEKSAEIDKLRKEMLVNIRKVKIDMLS